MQTYIWQSRAWPNFYWNDSEVLLHLSHARKIQGKILALAEEVGIATHAQILIEDAKETSSIEGEKLDRDSIRSSVARRVGLSIKGLPPIHRNVDGLVEMLIDVRRIMRNHLQLTALKAGKQDYSQQVIQVYIK